MKTDINTYTFKGIPVKVYAHPSPKRLIFINHGIVGSKERILTMFGVNLARIGYEVVAIDACKHGQRGEAPFKPYQEEPAAKALFDIVKKTSEDVLRLYHAKYKSAYPTFDILGVSMGGYVAYYTATQSSYVAYLVPVISSPDFSAGLSHTGITFDEDTIKKVESMDPSKHPKRFRFKEACALVGDKDSLIPMTQTKMFVKENEILPIDFKVYDTSHKVVPQMQEDIIAFLKARI